MKVYFIILLIPAFFLSCKSKQGTEFKTKSTVSENNIGYSVYNRYCLACHQTNGSGVPGMFPPFTKNERMNSNNEHLIKTVLQGVSGEIEVDGQIYKGAMPAHNYLTDEQVAEVLNYIRLNFGNSKNLISSEEVQKIRGSLYE